MSDNHQTRRPSNNDDAGFNAPSPSSSGQANFPAADEMPSLERNQYSNQQSVKVNSGLNLGSAIFNAAMPVMDMDFSMLAVPIVMPEPALSTEQLVEELLNPPAHAFLYGTLSIQWVMGVVGHTQFRFRSSDERYVLANDSEIRTKGGEHGMPAMYLEWLCGDDATVSATEQNLVLTPKFFEQLK